LKATSDHTNDYITQFNCVVLQACSSVTNIPPHMWNCELTGNG